MNRKGLIFCVLFYVMLSGGFGMSVRGDFFKANRVVSEEVLKKKLARYVPTRIRADLKGLSKDEMEMLKLLVKAAEKMDLLFWKQVSEEGLKVLDQVKALKGSYPEKLKKYLLINYGVWDRLDGHEPFIGDKKKPKGANYYPEDITKEEFERHLHENPGDREAFQSNFTVIKRGEDGKLFAVPYSVEYGDILKEASELLKMAAELSKNESLKKYLVTRADAFLKNDYFESDIAWMDISGSAIEVTIGPYEVYEDMLFNYKAAFEAFITIVDEKETKKLEMLEGLLDEFERNLPIPDEHKNFARGKSSPIRVVNLILSSGDTKAGVQTLAFNLPNDERVREAKGTKKVLLKNVGEAKFNKILFPISKEVVDRSLLKYITFNAYFNKILMHEVAHGLGPGSITLADGTKTTVNLALKEMYSPLEEAKADVMGIYNTLYLVNKGTYPAKLEMETMATFLAGIFRSVRFGVDAAHGKANMMEFNYLREKGAFTYDEKTGRFGVDRAKFAGAIRDMVRDICMIQALGDYEAAREFIAKYGNMPDEVKAALEKVKKVPVDIFPIYDF